MPQGRFITFEGGEGAGKSTQVDKLRASLEDKGIDVLVTREPGGSPSAENIRSLLVTGAPDRWSPMTEALLHTAARQEHLENTVRPALATGQWVLCDRFFDSTMAYQGYAQGLGKHIVEQLNAMVVKETIPDLTLVFDLPVEQGLARTQGRGGNEDRYERMGQSFHETLRSAFLDIVRENAGRCELVDATLSIDDIAERVWTIVGARYFDA